ncbi:hypothetical protein RQP46_003106 [Phenoliferia psychrophenolica]
MDASVSLPTELLEDIFEYAAGFKRSTSLGRFALVCRTWRQPAQRALFTSVVLKSGRQARGWLASPLREHYRAKHLEFGLWTYIPLGLEVLAAAPTASLTLNHSLDNSHSAYEWVTSPQAAGLQRLCLRWPEFFPSTPKPLTCRLRHLEINIPYSHETTRISKKTYHSILKPSHATLETLHLTGDLSNLIEYFAWSADTGNGPFQQVKYLILDTVTPPTSLKSLLSVFPSLLRLEARRALLFQNALIAAVVETPTACLEELSIDDEQITNWTNIELLNALKQPHLAGLTRISLPSTDKATFGCDGGTALLEECKERSISIECHYGYMTPEAMLAPSPASSPLRPVLSIADDGTLVLITTPVEVSPIETTSVTPLPSPPSAPPGPPPPAPITTIDGLTTEQSQQLLVDSPGTYFAFLVAQQARGQETVEGRDDVEAPKDEDGSVLPLAVIESAGLKVSVEGKERD